MARGAPEEEAGATSEEEADTISEEEEIKTSEKVTSAEIHVRIDNDDKDKKDSVEFKLFADNAEICKFSIGVGQVWADWGNVYITIVASGTPSVTVVNNEYHYTVVCAGVADIPIGSKRTGKLVATKTNQSGMASSFVVTVRTDKNRRIEVIHSPRAFFGSRRGESGPLSHSFGGWKW